MGMEHHSSIVSSCLNQFTYQAWGERFGGPSLPSGRSGGCGAPQGRVEKVAAGKHRSERDHRRPMCTYLYLSYKDKNIIYYIFICVPFFDRSPLWSTPCPLTFSLSLKKILEFIYFIYLLKNHWINHTALVAEAKKNRTDQGRGACE